MVVRQIILTRCPTLVLNSNHGGTVNPIPNGVGPDFSEAVLTQQGTGRAAGHEPGRARRCAWASQCPIVLPSPPRLFLMPMPDQSRGTQRAPAAEERTAASMKATPLTPSSMVGKCTPGAGAELLRAAMMACATSL